MDETDAAALIAGGVPTTDTAGAGTWADLGAGRGVFTAALAALLGPAGRVYAVDREPSAVAALGRLAAHRERAAIILPRRADFADEASWVALGLPPLDGVLLANALHFVPASQQAAVLSRLAAGLRPGGRMVVVEYERRAPSRWVPHPVSRDRLRTMLPMLVGPLEEIGSRPSAFGGLIYAAVAERRSDA